MKIDGMEQFNVETVWPARINIERLYDDIMASIYLSQAKRQKVLVLLKEDYLGIFVSPYTDTELPDWWKDAKIIYRQTFDE